MENTKPMVDWQSPDLLPNVKDGDSETFWIAVQRNRNGESPIFVFDAQYINKPLKFDDEDLDQEEPLGDYLEDSDGRPVEAIGWYSTLSHPEYSSYYEPLSFDKDNVLLGWGEYLKPDFKQGSR